MNPVLKNVLAVIAGIIIGGLVNYGLILILGGLIPIPEGVDPSDMESIKANIHRYTPLNFMQPFLAHAIGTLAGAFVAAKLAATRKLTMALIVGFFFLLGGISAVMMIPGPMWFAVLDIVVAYIPMAWLGHKLAS